MSDEERTEAEPQDSGVFGKLPSTRPGVRSPRRGKGSAKGRSAGSSKATKRAPGRVGGKASKSAAEGSDLGTASPDVRRTDPTGHSAAPSSPPQPGPTPPAGAAREPETPETGDGPGVEDLAWAGITVAAEAATLGVRLLSRALEAVRGPGDSR
jgi:hypothetical protein